MDPTDPMQVMQLQIAQSMIEHEMLAQSLRAFVIVWFVTLIAAGWLVFSMWRRSRVLADALVETTRLGSRQLVETVKSHSLELASLMMQQSHAFEGIVSRVRNGSARSLGKASPNTPARPTPVPPPMPSSDDETPATGTIRPERKG